MTLMIELLIYLGRVLFMGFSLATGQAMTRVWRCWWPNARSRWLEVCSNADQSDKNLTYSNTDQTPDRDDSTCPNSDQWERKKPDSLKSWPIGKQEEEKLDLSKCWPIWNQPMCWPTIISPLSDNSWYLSWKKYWGLLHQRSDYLKCNFHMDENCFITGRSDRHTDVVYRFQIWPRLPWAKIK